MIDEHFRQVLPQFTEGLIEQYKKLGLTPNHITLGGMGLAFIAAFCTSFGWAWLAIAIWWLGRLLDGTDGIYARATGQASAFGAFLDILCDMAAYSAMIFGFAALHPELQTYWMVILYLYVLCVTGALSMGAIEQKLNIDTTDNRGVRLAAGLAEGGETGIAYTLFLLFPAQINLLVPLWIGVLVVTVVARALLAQQVFSAAESGTE